MNIWNLSGTVKNFGIKGQQYKKLWIAVETPSTTSNSSVFINFDLDPDPTSKRGKVGSYVESTLAKDKTIFVSDITLAMIKFSKKEGEEWVSEEKIGLKASISNITFLDGPSLSINSGFLVGKVTSHTGKKMIVEHSYLIPKENKWKTRPVPVLIDESIEYMYTGKNLTGKKVFTSGQIVGTDKSMYVLGKQIIVQ